MVSRQLTIVGSNGDVIPIAEVSDDFAMGRAARGFGIAPQVLTELEGAGAGSVVRYTRTGSRSIDLPVHIFGVDRGEVQGKLDRLAAALDEDVPGRPAPRLRFRLHSGAVYDIEVHYLTGAETQLDTSAGDDWATWLLSLRAPDPYWTALDEIAFTFRPPGDRRGIFPNFVLMQLASSQVFGSQEVVNPGTVSAPLRWQLYGPADSIVATSASGEVWEFTPDSPLEAGDVITIDTDTLEVLDQTGDNRYGELGNAPKLWHLPAGASIVSLVMTNTGADSLAVALYKPRRKLVH